LSIASPIALASHAQPLARSGPYSREAALAVLTVHIVNGILVLALSLVAGIWGAIAWWRRQPTVVFWYVLRALQVVVVLQVAFGSILLLSGRNATTGLHYLYGVLPLLVSLLAEALRAGIAERELEGLDFDSLPADRRRAIALAITRRETGAMAVAALVIFLLALRAVGTAG
jgi:hypothetical protein